jgi:hypothetical protein
MAIRKIVTLTGNKVLQTPFGAVLEGQGTMAIATTIRVVEISGNKTEVNARVVFTGETLKFEKSYVVPVSIENGAPNFICQAYLYLKTLPEFDNCEDC